MGRRERRREEREELWGWSLALLPPTEATVAVEGGGRRGGRGGEVATGTPSGTRTTPEERGRFWPSAGKERESGDRGSVEGAGDH